MATSYNLLVVGSHNRASICFYGAQLYLCITLIIYGGIQIPNYAKLQQCRGIFPRGNQTYDVQPCTIQWHMQTLTLHSTEPHSTHCVQPYSLLTLCMHKAWIKHIVKSGKIILAKFYIILFLINQCWESSYVKMCIWLTWNRLLLFAGANLLWQIIGTVTTALLNGPKSTCIYYSGLWLANRNVSNFLLSAS